MHLVFAMLVFHLYRDLRSRLSDHRGLPWWGRDPDQQRGRALHGALRTQCQRPGLQRRGVPLHDHRDQRGKVWTKSVCDVKWLITLFFTFLVVSQLLLLPILIPVSLGVSVQTRTTFTCSFTICLPSSWPQDCLVSQRQPWSSLELTSQKSPSPCCPLFITIWVESPQTTRDR